ncbi:hypothetical protein M011DRAFT_530255 [Sporormia fimetaria CBS 119925]|uniref:Uncharacterized protein n=1 Tax=Sporormia fimetaria CBS 119925 TaxID=1340428 RepID=A0A6A6UUD3_9PLEO|nr:hypothetical protein M011DRAFT_530255 [Sporormia fimetaria CBS 119925]
MRFLSTFGVVALASLTPVTRASCDFHLHVPSEPDPPNTTRYLTTSGCGRWVADFPDEKVTEDEAACFFQGPSNTIIEEKTGMHLVYVAIRQRDPRQSVGTPHENTGLMLAKVDDIKTVPKGWNVDKWRFDEASAPVYKDFIIVNAEYDDGEAFNSTLWEATPHTCGPYPSPRDICKGYSIIACGGGDGGRDDRVRFDISARPSGK